MAIYHETPVLVVGGGPAGLIAALQLANNGTQCTLVERNLDTTKWPKMDITNCRSMEILKRLGVDEGLRAVGVPGNYSFDVIFSSGLAEGGEKLAQWDLPSPDEWRRRIQHQNDGSMPREPYQRCSQAIFEAWLKPYISAHPLITTHFGMRFEKLTESDRDVTSELVAQNGEKHMVKSKYVVACDGAGSKVRKSLGISLTGGPVPMAMFLVHFKSRDLTRLHKQGQFWHIFFTKGATIIAQDEVDTWTIHTPVPIGTDISTLDPRTAIYDGLGTIDQPYPIEVDEILVTSSWRPNICLADRYISEKGRVFLSGDSAHQNVPTGGYGMNTAVGDSFDIGWKLAAVLAGHGGPHLLRSYEEERRPVAMRNIDRSGKHGMIHHTYREWCAASPQTLYSNTDAAEKLKTQISRFVEENDGENKDHGIELGYRYNGSPVIIPDTETSEPAQTERDYIPGTWPGSRAPHVFLSDGKTSMFDLFGQGQEYTLIDFTSSARYKEAFDTAAKSLKVPLKLLHLPCESHVHKVWQRDAVLVRPDDHVAWRLGSGDSVNATDVLKVAVGLKEAPKMGTSGTAPKIASRIQKNGFTSTVGNVDQENIEGLGAFQQ